jgi:hypothetical protein
VKVQSANCLERKFQDVLRAPMKVMCGSWCGDEKWMESGEEVGRKDGVTYQSKERFDAKASEKFPKPKEGSDGHPVIA